MLVFSLVRSWMRRRSRRNQNTPWCIALRLGRPQLETLEERVPPGALVGPGGVSPTSFIPAGDITTTDFSVTGPTPITNTITTPSPDPTTIAPTVLTVSPDPTTTPPVSQTPTTPTATPIATTNAPNDSTNAANLALLAGAGGIANSPSVGGSSAGGSGASSGGAGGAAVSSILANWAPPTNPMADMSHGSDLITTSPIFSGGVVPPGGSNGPVAPTPPVLAPGFVQITGFEDSHGNALPAGNLTNDAKPIVVGNGAAGATLTIQIDGSVSGKTTVAANSQWTYAIPTALAQGDHKVEVQSSGNNLLSMATTTTVSIDLTTPTVTLTAPDFAGYQAPQLQVQASENTPYPLNPTVHIDVDLKHDGTFTDAGDQDFAVTTLQPDGTASFQLQHPLPAGTYSLQARVADLAGNVGVSATSSMVVDPNAGYDGSQALLNLALGQKYGTPIQTPNTNWGAAMPGTPQPDMPNPPAPASPPSAPLAPPTQPGFAAPGPINFQPPTGFDFLQFDSQGRVLVDVHSTLPKYLTDLTTDLKNNLGFQVNMTVTAQNMVEGWLPVSQILALPNAANFGSVVPVNKPFTRATITPESGKIIKADTFSAANNVNGAGETIGVISDSVNDVGGGLADSVAVGALPNNVNVIADDPNGNGTDEGRAMLEIAHEVAPGASLAFDAVGDSPQSMAQSINNLVSAGSNIVTDDVGFGDEPFFNDGVISQAAEGVITNNGTFYTSAAGNDANHGYLANWNPTSTTVGGVSGDFQTFSNGSQLQTFSLAQGDSVSLSFQWDSAFLEGGGTGNFAVPNDLQVLVTDSSGNALSTPQVFNSQGTNTNEAYQDVEFTNDGSFGTNNFAFAFNLVSGPAPNIIAWISNDDGNPASDPMALDEGAPTLYGHPEAAGVVATGAVNWQTPTTPEAFTALGGSQPILFDNSGNRLSVPIHRSEPLVAAPDGVHTSFFGSDDGNGGFEFFGTSAATPAVAGAAALLFQQAPGATQADVTQYLQQNALNLNSPSLTGAGLIQLTVRLVPPGGGGGTIGPATIVSNGDIYEPNQTSDTAFDFSTLKAANNQLEYEALTIANTGSGLPDYDWFKWSVQDAGSFNAAIAVTSGSNLELHIFTVDGNGDLVDLADDTSGTNTIKLSAPVTAGQEMYVEVKGINTALGVYGQGTYNLFVQDAT